MLHTDRQTPRTFQLQIRTLHQLILTFRRTPRIILQQIRTFHPFPRLKHKKRVLQRR